MDSFASKKLMPWFAFAGLLIIIDQGIKYLIVATMALGERVPMLPFLDLLHARNFGVAFSMFASAPEMVLVIVKSCITLFIIVMLWRTPPADFWARLAFTLILGGAIGNVIDRARLGYVVDYVYFHTQWFDFAIFNAADAFITCGAVLLIFDELILKNRKPNKEAS